LTPQKIRIASFCRRREREREREREYKLDFLGGWLGGELFYKVKSVGPHRARLIYTTGPTNRTKSL